MPLYDYYCKEHETYEEVLCAVKGLPHEGDEECPKCPVCDKYMIRTFMNRRKKQTSTSYGTGLVSQSLAISPDQIEEHGKLFPDVKVLPDGCVVFENYKQHDNYLKRTGFKKLPQRIKGLGSERIA